MKIGIIGATGKQGNLVLKEAVRRGHMVTAIIRNPSKLTDKGVDILEKDILNLTAHDLKKFDAVVNAFRAPFGQEHLHVEAGRILIEAMKGAPDTRLIVVGGAGSLFVDENKTTKLLDTPEFPKEVYPTAFNQGKNLEDLQNSKGIKWTFISPSAFFNAAGKRTGAYKTGKDNLMVNSKGNSYVSYADFAIALVDEIEKPQHIDERFTVVSEE